MTQGWPKGVPRGSKKHCKNGHDLTDPENVIIHAIDGHRRCRQCHNDAQERFRRSKAIPPRRRKSDA